MRYDLLEIRLKDKTFVKATSDVNIKSIVAFFDKNGSQADKCEAYFYAGSTYRDLHDTPRSLEYFFRALDIAENEHPCDSAMLRNIYSNLSFLFYNVQDYSNALAMAKKEYALSQMMGDLSTYEPMHVGAALMQLDSIHAAEKYFVKAFELMEYNRCADKETAAALLLQFAELGRMDLADNCYEILRLAEKPAMSCLGFGEYFGKLGITDSACYYYNKVLAENCPLEAKYDAAHNLFELKRNEANAALFMKISDSLNLGERQKRAATINNLHQYHRDIQSEKEIVQEKEKYRSYLIIVSLVLILTIVFAILCYMHKKYRYTQKLLRQSETVSKLRENLKQMHENIIRIEGELRNAESAYTKSQKELEDMKSLLAETKEELAAKKGELEERIEQTAEVVRMLHSSELTMTAEDVVNSIRTASEGKYHMKTSDWLHLYQAVDSLHPTFKDELVKKIEKVQRATETSVLFAPYRIDEHPNRKCHRTFPRNRLEVGEEVWRDSGLNVPKSLAPLSPSP